MNVLIACEESQRVCIEFRKKGHNAFSCDLMVCSGGHPEWHIKGDVRTFLNPFEFMPPDELHFTYGIPFETLDGRYHEIRGKWDLIIGFPPCTNMTKASARWMYPNGILSCDRLQAALRDKDLFMSIYNADCEKIVIENPTPLAIIDLPPCSQVIQPYMFDEPYSKRTLLWVKGVPPLVPTCILDSYTNYICSNCSQAAKGKKGGCGASKDHTGLSRSKTFIGVAKAMAEQWG